MITAADSNVLLDFFSDDEHAEASAAQLRRCFEQGPVIACDVVWAEVGAWFPRPADASAALEDLGVTFSAIDAATALIAGAGWRTYRKRGGPRSRLVADFLIGAHAMHQADRLLTRDRGFYRTYFKRLKILDPARA